MLKDKTVTEFIEILASDAPAPGGGSVAALSGSLSAALVQMVSGLTLGREKYKEFEAETTEIASNAAVLRQELLKLVDDDTESYNEVSAALAMPKNTPEEKKERSAAIQNSFKTATLTPLKTMEKCLDCIRLTHAAYGRTNLSAVSDLGVSALCAVTCARGAWLNVKINLGSIKDAAFVDEVKEKAAALLAECESLGEAVYAKIEESI